MNWSFLQITYVLICSLCEKFIFSWTENRVRMMHARLYLFLYPLHFLNSKPNFTIFNVFITFISTFIKYTNFIFSCVEFAQNGSHTSLNMVLNFLIFFYIIFNLVSASVFVYIHIYFSIPWDSMRIHIFCPSLSIFSIFNVMLIPMLFGFIHFSIH